MEILLHAEADDFLLRSTKEQDPALSPVSILETTYLTDTDGNRLTDTDGNYLTAGSEWIDSHARMLHANHDDFLLRVPLHSLELTALADDFQLNSE